MASSSFAELLEDDGCFRDVWDGLDDSFRSAMQTRGMGKPLIWAGLAGRETGDGLRDRLENHLIRLKVLNPAADPSVYSDNLDGAVALAEAARAPTQTWIEQMSTVSDLQLNVDRAIAARSRASEVEESDLKRLRSKVRSVWS